MTDKRWKCECCDEVSTCSELLTALSPFDPEDTLTGCPHCLAVNGFDLLCATDGCMKLATCGGPSADGVYRQTCGDHADWLRRRD